MALTIEESSSFIAAILKLYPQQTNAYLQHTAMIEELVETHIQRMNAIGLTALRDRFAVLQQLNYTACARKELKFFGDAIKYVLSDRDSFNDLKNQYLRHGSELYNPEKPDLAANDAPKKLAAPEKTQQILDELQSLFDDKTQPKQHKNPAALSQDEQHLVNQLLKQTD